MVIHSNIRTVRVTDRVWRKAHAKAKANGTTVSALINEWLRQYIAPPPK
jgi:predicted HicB family RNase H-like nuclease